MSSALRHHRLTWLSAECSLCMASLFHMVVKCVCCNFWTVFQEHQLLCPSGLQPPVQCTRKSAKVFCVVQQLYLQTSCLVCKMCVSPRGQLWVYHEILLKQRILCCYCAALCIVDKLKCNCCQNGDFAFACLWCKCASQYSVGWQRERCFFSWQHISAQQHGAHMFCLDWVVITCHSHIWACVCEVWVHVTHLVPDRTVDVCVQLSFLSAVCVSLNSSTVSGCPSDGVCVCVCVCMSGWKHAAAWISRQNAKHASQYPRNSVTLIKIHNVKTYRTWPLQDIHMSCVMWDFCIWISVLLCLLFLFHIEED